MSTNNQVAVILIMNNLLWKEYLKCLNFLGHKRVLCGTKSKFTINIAPPTLIMTEKEYNSLS